MNAQLVHELARRDPAAAEAHVQGIAATGVDWVRSNVDWASLEPARPGAAGPAYDFASHDAWVGLLARHDLRWAPTAIGAATPEWARDPFVAAECGERSPPAPAPFAAMVAALAERYGSHGSFWDERPELESLPVRDVELWNEPNHAPFWCPRPDPARYAAVAAAAARALNDADPRARAVLGGLAAFAPAEGTGQSPGEFAAALAAAEPELPQLVDLVAVHLYAGDVAGIAAKLEEAREGLAAAGFDAPLAVNELGWPTAGAGSVAPVPEQERAALVASATEAVAGSACDVAALALHTWITPQAHPGDAEQWFGVADPATAAPYPAAEAYAASVARLAGGVPAPPADVASCEE